MSDYSVPTSFDELSSQHVSEVLDAELNQASDVFSAQRPLFQQDIDDCRAFEGLSGARKLELCTKLTHSLNMLVEQSVRILAEGDGVLNALSNAGLVRNKVRMLLFLLSQIVACEEKTDRAHAAVQAAAGRTVVNKDGRVSSKRGRKKQHPQLFGDSSDVESDYEEEKASGSAYSWSGRGSIMAQKAFVMDSLTRCVGEEGPALWRWWSMSQPEQGVGVTLMQCGLTLLENRRTLRSATHRNSASVLVRQCVVQWGLEERCCARLMFVVQNYDFAGAFIAQLLTQLRNDTQHSGISDAKENNNNNNTDNDATESVTSSQQTSVGDKLILDMVAEISRFSDQVLSRDAEGARCLADFLTAVCLANPDLVLTRLNLVVSHLSSESYVMRNATVSVLGGLVKHIALEKHRMIVQTCAGSTDSANHNDSTHSNDDQPDNNDEDEALAEAYNDEVDITAPVDVSARVSARSHLLASSKAFQTLHILFTSLLSRLIERVLDVSSFTRVRVVKTVNQLVREPLDASQPDVGGVIPVAEFPTICGTLVDRLQDKASNVRAAACQTLISLVCEFPARYVNFQKEQACAEEGKDVAEEKPSDADKPSDTDKPSDKPSDTDKPTEIAALNLSEQFMRVVSGAVDTATNYLMLSGTVSDVLAAIRVCVHAQEHGILGAARGIRSMIQLVWSKEDRVQSAVLKGFSRLFVGDLQWGRLSQKQRRVLARGIARNLVHFYQTCQQADATVNTTTEEEGKDSDASGGSPALSAASLQRFTAIVSLEEILKHLLAQDNVASAPVCHGLIDMVLKDAVSSSSEGNATSRSAAFAVLAMVGRCEPRIVLSKLHKLCDSVLGEASGAVGEHTQCADLRALATLLLNVSSLLCAARQLSVETKRSTTAKKTKSLHTVASEVWEGCVSRNLGRQMVGCVLSLLHHRVSDTGGFTEWVTMLRPVCAVMFTLFSNATDLVSEMLRMLAVGVQKSRAAGQVSSKWLSGLMLAGGQVSEALVEEMDRIESRCKKQYAARQATKARQAEEKSGKDDDFDSLGASATIDYELELARLQAERNILDKAALMGSIRTLAYQVVREASSSVEMSPTVLSSAAWCVAQCMALSADSCRRYVGPLFKMLSGEQGTRMNAQGICNLLTVIGKTHFRFPNIMLQWIPGTYPFLAHSDASVRMRTLLMLTNLVMNDMLKAKGAAVVVARSLCDPCPEVARVARVLFIELSRKGADRVYNLYPDVVSTLSATVGRSMADKRTGDRTSMLTRADFEGIVSFLSNFLTKDKQNDDICTKLCNRIGAVIQQSRKSGKTGNKGEKVDKTVVENSAVSDENAVPSSDVNALTEALSGLTVDSTDQPTDQPTDKPTDKSSDDVTQFIFDEACVNQMRLIVFALSRLRITTNTAKRISQCFQMYRPLLSNLYTYRTLRGMVTKGRKLMASGEKKTKNKTAMTADARLVDVDAFLQKMESVHQKLLADYSSLRKATLESKTSQEQTGLQFEEDSDSEGWDDEVDSALKALRAEVDQKKAEAAQQKREAREAERLLRKHQKMQQQQQGQGQAVGQ